MTTPANPSPGALSPDQAVEIANTISGQTLSIVEQTNERVAGMLKQGYGVTFLAFGFVTVLASVLLRLFREDQITTTVFVALLVLGLVFVAMSFAFLYMDARISQEMMRTVAEHNERVTAAVLDYQKGLQQRQEALQERERETAQDLSNSSADLEAAMQRTKGPAGLQSQQGA